jgi:hypothetical protein
MMAVTCPNSKELADWLDTAGIVIKGQHASRVILDIGVGRPVKVYVEQFGDSRIFEVEPLDCRGAEVRIAGHQALAMDASC